MEARCDKSPRNRKMFIEARLSFEILGRCRAVSCVRRGGWAVVYVDCRQTMSIMIGESDVVSYSTLSVERVR